MPAPMSLRLDDQPPIPIGAEPIGGPYAPTSVDVPNDDPNVSFKDGVLQIVNSDGSTVIDFNPDLSDTKVDDKDFYRNIANEIPSDDLAKIANDLLTGIDYDEMSRKEWLDMRARGIKLLGLKLEDPRGDLGTSSAPLEGMSVFNHPLLLEATVRFQASACGELMPAAGPVKVRNDAVMPPEQPPMGHNGGPPLDPSQPPEPPLDDLADALQKDLNHYLTVVATEWVPDFDRMLFYVGFGGDGFKKVYNCPLKNRPVSESVDAENIIVSNAATDIRNCGRVTHKNKMRPSTLKRMQIAGAYRDVSLAAPQVSEKVNQVDQKKAEIAGVKPQPLDNKDADYTVFETYCELDIEKFAPKQFKGKGLPLPYVVTLEKESRQVLAVRRNWDETDPQCLAKQFFVHYPFIRGLGFYAIGLVHLLGNITIALTAIFREFIDKGMFANFPGFLYAKGAGRQLSNQIRVPPGGGMAIDVPPGMGIKDAIMPVPYGDITANFAMFVKQIEDMGQRLGQTAEIQVGEGKQEMPVGTTMALIEQATKMLDSVHKRLCRAMAEEFGLLKERFRENPEAFVKSLKRPTKPWTEETFRQALDKYELVPVADPNNPTSLHRTMKANIIDGLITKYPQLMNAMAGLKRILRTAGIDSEGLLNTQPAPPPPDPRMEAIKAKSEQEKVKAQIAWVQTQIKAEQVKGQTEGAQSELAVRERIEMLKVEEGRLRLQQEMIIHAHEINRDNASAEADIEKDAIKGAHDVLLEQAKGQSALHMEQQKNAQEVKAEGAKTAIWLAAEHAKQGQKLETDREKHGHTLQTEREKHEQSLRHKEATHEADLEHKKALARVAAQAKPKEKK
jgi:hypothetical protein